MFRSINWNLLKISCSLSYISMDSLLLYNHSSHVGIIFKAPPWFYFIPTHSYLIKQIIVVCWTTNIVIHDKKESLK